MLAAVSPAVLVPSLMILQKDNYGVAKGIPTTLIAASSFDDICAITVFGVFLTIAISHAPGQIAGEENPKPVWWEALYNLIQIVTGLVVGLFIGWTMRCCLKCSDEKMKWPKFLFTLFWALAVPIACELINFPEAMFICVIFFGYQCNMAWGDKKPEHELALLWRFCQPVLFGSVGAAV